LDTNHNVSTAQIHAKIIFIVLVPGLVSSFKTIGTFEMFS